MELSWENIVTAVVIAWLLLWILIPLMFKMHKTKGLCFKYKNYEIKEK